MAGRGMPRKGAQIFFQNDNMMTQWEAVFETKHFLISIFYSFGGTAKPLYIYIVWAIKINKNN